MTLKRTARRGDTWRAFGIHGSGAGRRRAGAFRAGAGQQIPARRNALTGAYRAPESCAEKKIPRSIKTEFSPGGGASVRRGITYRAYHRQRGKARTKRRSGPDPGRRSSRRSGSRISERGPCRSPRPELAGVFRAWAGYRCRREETRLQGLTERRSGPDPRGTNQEQVSPCHTKMHFCGPQQRPAPKGGRASEQRKREPRSRAESKAGTRERGKEMLSFVRENPGMSPEYQDIFFPTLEYLTDT